MFKYEPFLILYSWEILLIFILEDNSAAILQDK
jgi:hypothetical protein